MKICSFIGDRLKSCGCETNKRICCERCINYHQVVNTKLLLFTEVSQLSTLSTFDLSDHLQCFHVLPRNACIFSSVVRFQLACE